VCTSAASVSDVHMLPDLLHGDEKKVWGDAGYQGQTEAIHAAAPAAQDMTSRRAKYKGGVDEAERRKNRTKARVRSKVEVALPHPEARLRITKVRYRRPEEESRVAAGGLRAGQPLPTPQAAGPAGGVVSPEAGNRPPEIKLTPEYRLFLAILLSCIDQMLVKTSRRTKMMACAEVP